MNAEGKISQDPSGFLAFAFQNDEGEKQLHLMVEGIKCAGCVRSIEKVFMDVEGLTSGRVNMSTNRLVLKWNDDQFDPTRSLSKVEEKGFRLAPFDPEKLGLSEAKEDKKLMIDMAVAGFAAMNVMLLSVAVWSGAFSSMGEATRGLFHWISALIALPTILFSGRSFYASALSALKGGRLNMDVPISLAVILAGGMSLYETVRGGEHAYFDAAVMLLFFLLIGRFLDRRARTRARSAGEHLLALQDGAASVIEKNGLTKSYPVHLVEVGMKILILPGDKIPVDGIIINGQSDIDTSLVTGESLPRNFAKGDEVFAGTQNISGQITVEVTKPQEETLLSEIASLMEAAEQGKSQYIRLADKVAGFYAPVVHILGLITFLGWWGYMGVPWQAALLNGIAVLIITCPCALGLAVPAVQVIASGRLLKAGIILKAADGLERASNIDTIVFDKTGTLTLGKLKPTNIGSVPKEVLNLASSLAKGSSHPLAKALAKHYNGDAQITHIEENPGSGLKGQYKGKECRLGSREWCNVKSEEVSTGPELWFQIEGMENQLFTFRDQVREDAHTVIQNLKNAGFKLVLLSGDRVEVAKRLAEDLEIENWQGQLKPQQKVEEILSLKEKGNSVLMVGDGLNDAPALAAADASISPSTASDISQTAADFVFQGEKLSPIMEILDVSKRSDSLARQNFGLAFLYNIIAIPIAVIGLASPLMAALAMSISSLAVISNSLRLKRS